MRALWLCLVIASSAGPACSSHGSTGPAWPKSHASEDDGGESLEPRVASAIEEQRAADDDDHPAVATPASAPAATAAPASAPAAAAPAPTGELQVLEGDEIIIEVDE
jgi:hypothetical protein